MYQAALLLGRPLCHSLHRSVILLSMTKYQQNSDRSFK